MTETLYKVLNVDGSPYHGGVGVWHLPNGKRPGKWMPLIADPVPCRRGYHVATAAQLFSWFGPAIFEVEVRGARVDHDDKSVVGQARLIRRTPWDERTARLFAADCPEHVLHLFERVRPDDTRPRDCIEVARRFAEGEATSEQLEAVRDAAWDATGDAAGDAAWDAARYAARSAVWSAAWYAARSAARSAARDGGWWAVGWDAERRWQIERLAHYLNGTA